MKALTSEIEKNVVATKAVAFTREIIEVYELLHSRRSDHILSRQLLQSGTIIGTLLIEAECTESKYEFLHVINMALKEALETAHWLLLLKEGKHINVPEYDKIKADCMEITTLLSDIIYQLQ